MTPPAVTASRTTATAVTVRLLVAARLLQTKRDRQPPASPAALAKRLIPGYVITPTIALLSDVLADAVERPDRGVIVNSAQCVVVHVGGCSDPQQRISGFAFGGGCRHLRSVAGQNLRQHIHRGVGVGGFRGQDAVRIVFAVDK